MLWTYTTAAIAVPAIAVCVYDLSSAVGRAAGTGNSVIMIPRLSAVNTTGGELAERTIYTEKWIGRVAWAGGKYRMSLSVDKKEQDDRVIFTLDGELDVASSPMLREELSRAIEGGCRRIVIDMSSVSYMDSSGLSALVVAHKALGSRGSLALVGSRPTIERVLRFTQFDKVLDLYRSFEDLEAGNRDNLRAVSGVSKSVLQKQKQITRPTSRRQNDGRRLQ